MLQRQDCGTYMRAHNMRNSNKILHDDQTRCEENFLHGRPRMVNRHLFAVANFLVTCSSLLFNAVLLLFTQVLRKYCPGR